MENLVGPLIADLQAETGEVEDQHGAEEARRCVRRGYAALALQAIVMLASRSARDWRMGGGQTALAVSGSGSLAAGDPRRALRWAVPFSIATIVTAALFWLMSALIASDDHADTPRPSSGPIVWTRTLVDTAPIPRLTEEEPPPKRPTPMAQPTTPIRQSGAEPFGSRAFDPTKGFKTGHRAFKSADLIVPYEGSSHAIAPAPQARVSPVYPARAVERGIEGWVVVEFGISSTGRVEDVVIVESSPDRIFDRAARQAVSKWKYSRSDASTNDPGAGSAGGAARVQTRLVFELD